MTDAIISRVPLVHTSEAAVRNRRRRQAVERRFQLYGLAALTVAGAALVILLGTIVHSGFPAFVQNYIAIDVTFDEATIDPDGARDPATLGSANYRKVLSDSLKLMFPEVTERSELNRLRDILESSPDFVLRSRVLDDAGVIGTTERVWFRASDHVDLYAKGDIRTETPEEYRPLKNNQIAWYETLKARGQAELRFNTTLFTHGDSRQPEHAGLLGALIGSLLTLSVTLVLSFPIAVMAAVYLEEFAPTNRFTDLVEININNLAAVPSIVFGLLGLAVFLNFWGLPRSAPLVGGLVLTLVTLPTIVIASRAALKAVPPSIREAARGVGASEIQVVFHHAVPLAMPGILTGTIIGMARALGETAPLLMIGMVAFIVDIPSSIMDSATVLPVQVYLWADAPERDYGTKTSAAIMVLLAFLFFMNATAIYLRRRFERRW